MKKYLQMSSAAVIIGAIRVKMVTMFRAGAKVFIIAKLFRSLFFSFFQKNRHMQKAFFLLTENKCFPSAALSGINEKDLKQEQ